VRDGRTGAVEAVALRAEMKSEFTAVRAELKSGLADAKKANAAEFAAVRAEIAALSRAGFRMFAITMATLILGFAGLLITRV
jgi:predicted phage gp36 major capsid-like protein